jgi:cadmium resistance protein CadD (predicted permease)
MGVDHEYRDHGGSIGPSESGDEQEDLVNRAARFRIGNALGGVLAVAVVGWVLVVSESPSLRWTAGTLGLIIVIIVLRRMTWSEEAIRDHDAANRSLQRTKMEAEARTPYAR